MGIPMFLFWIFNKFVGFNAGVLAIAIAGVLALALKNYFMNFIEKRYIKSNTLVFIWRTGWTDALQQGCYRKQLFILAGKKETFA